MTTPDRPPYRVPTMSEIEAIEPNGLTVASTFAGAGGSCLGYRMAGYRVLWASEFVPAAAEVYRLNHPDVPVDERDLRTVDASEILEAIGLDAGELDLLDGSPPCASFSTAGRREATWGKTKAYSETSQRSDDLFYEYARILEGLRPRAFVAENVSGLVKGVAKGYFLRILERLRGAGYRVKAKLLDAQWLGVPQARQRLIFVGVRDDLDLEPAFPAPLPYRYSIRDAVPWISRVEGANGYDGHAYYDADRPAATIQASRALNVEALAVVEPESSMESHATGRAWHEIGGIGQSERYFQLVRPDPDAPAPTVTAAGGNAGLASIAHPYECRKLSIAELKRICAFPDDFRLSGTYVQQWERLGRAVPPLMMRAVAARLAEILA
jgi:DNA (cytosine-5)-methyltransferase 1